MKILFATGTHPRHGALARALASTGHLAGLLLERREVFVPEPPEHLAPDLAALFRRHFAAREEAEQAAFAPWDPAELAVPVLEVERDALNGEGTAAFLRSQAPDLFFSYGVHKLSPETLAALPGLRWNIHGGLSPWYRGVITHFWPSYFLEPQMTGMTVHELTEDIDGGPVVHQVAAPLVRGDGVHGLACRAVQALADELPELVRRAAAGELQPPRAPTTSGRIWRGRDWRAEHLRVVYELFEDRVVDAYLDGHLRGPRPRLVRQFPAT